MPMSTRLVVLESPYGSPNPEAVAENVAYAKQCVHDCLVHGEAPIASHLLFTQPGILDDRNPHERQLGMSAGHAWICKADAVVVYTDRGISPGMEKGIEVAKYLGIPVEYRRLNP